MLSLLANGLKIVQGEIKVENVIDGCCLELHGKFKMQRGEFQQECSWYGRMYNTRHDENIVGVEEYELQEVDSGYPLCENLFTEADVIKAIEFCNFNKAIGLDMFDG